MKQTEECWKYVNCVEEMSYCRAVFFINVFNSHFQDAFSLLAYSNPWSSPLGWQLCPSRREIVCAALNSAILGESSTEHFRINKDNFKLITIFFSPNHLESMNYSWRPPLEICMAHSCELLHLMASSSIGSCAFANIDDIINSTQ